MTSLPPPVQSVLELFRGPLASVRFADIDGAGLSQLADEVEAAASEVREQEAKLAELRQSLAQRHEALLALAQQALAYARVYAENDEALLDAVNRISLPRATKPRKGPGSKGASARGEAAGDGAEAPASDEADAAPREGSLRADGELTEASGPDGVEGDAPSPPPAAPARLPRKGRGAAPQRAAN